MAQADQELNHIARKILRRRNSPHAIAEIVAKQQGATVEQMQVWRLVLEVTQASGENGIRVPPELTMLGKTLLNGVIPAWRFFCSSPRQAAA